jgi:hypothetical protein
MTDTDTHRRLDTLFGVGVVLLVTAVVVLVLGGDRALPAPADGLSSLDVVAVLLVLSLATTFGSTLRRLDGDRSKRWTPFGRIQALENELGGLVDDYEFEVSTYRDELDQYTGDQKDEIVVARAELDRIETELAEVRTRLDKGRYIAAFRRYYAAQRDLVDVIPGMQLVDSDLSLNRDRFRELVSQTLAHAEVLGDGELVAALESYRRGAPTDEDGTPAPDDDDRLSTLKTALRQIHGAWLVSLDSSLRLRYHLNWFNVTMGWFVVVIFLGVVGSAAGALLIETGVLATTLVPISMASVGPVLLVLPVLFFGAFGAVLNLYRRFGAGVALNSEPALPEFPNVIVARGVVRSRVLWGAAAAFVVYVFTLLSGGLNAWSVVIVAVAAGASEQLLDRILEEQVARLDELTTAGRTDDSARTERDTKPHGANEAPVDKSTVVTN